MKKVEYKGHQGDVAIFEVDEFPQGTRIQDELTQRHQLALGELSGHNHYFPEGSEAVDLFKMEGEEFKGLSFFETKKEAELVHGRIIGFKGKEADQDYHNSMFLKPGKKYVTGIIPETDWVTKTIRKVID